MTSTIQRCDEAVPKVLELLPWWKRIESVKVSVYVPSTKYLSTFDMSFHRGGGVHRFDTVTREFKFNTVIGYDSTKGIRYSKSWTYSDSVISYKYAFGSVGSSVGYILYGNLEVDTGLGTIQYASMKQSLYEGGRDWTTGAIILSNLPDWTIQTIARHELHLVNGTANSCLIDVEHKVDKTVYQGNDTGQSSLTAGPHIPDENGITVGVVVTLPD